MGSLQNLLNLARRTNSPVFVYDAEMDHEYVLVSVDAYLDESYAQEDDILEDWYDIERRSLIEDMSSDALLDQINRDIAAWRAHKELDEAFERADVLEDELIDSATEPFHEEYMPELEWHTPASVFETYAPVQPPSDVPPHESYIDHDALRGLRPDANEPLQWEDDAWDAQFELPNEFNSQTAQLQPVRFEPVPFDPPLNTAQVESEPLPDSDAPVFYEEPGV